MQVVVLLAGVVDPKWRLERLGLRAGTQQPEEAGLPRRLSPFDEAALEIALKARDADPAVQVSAVLVGDAASDALLRSVAAFRPHRAFRFDPAGIPAWDARAALALLRAAVAAATAAPDLVLIGREFGDGDDGVLPPLLAEACGWQFCGQAYGVTIAEGGFVAQRMRGTREERLRLRPPAVVSVTNDRGNRLRHPLMKNVVIAKREPVQVVAGPPAASAGAVQARALALVQPAARGAGACRMLAGTLETQLAELAEHLRAARAGGAR